MIKNKISIGVITYNSFNKTKKSLDSVISLLDRKDVLELVILDNNSESKLVNFLEKFEKSHRKIKIIFSDKNLGCAGGRKKLLPLLKGNKILSLDSDVIVNEESFLDKLISVEQKSEIGLIGCAGANIDYEKIEFKLVEENYDGFVDAVIGYCQFFDKSIIDKGVNYDDYYYPNGEDDIDFSMQISKKLDLKCYKVTQKGFGLIHDYSHTNRGDVLKRDKNFKHIFKKFQIYNKNPCGRIKFAIDSSVILKKIKRCLGKINHTLNS